MRGKIEFLGKLSALAVLLALFLAGQAIVVWADCTGGNNCKTDPTNCPFTTCPTGLYSYSNTCGEQFGSDFAPLPSQPTWTCTGYQPSPTLPCCVYVGPPITATFAATPTTIALGQSSQLSWTTANATSVSIDKIGNASLSGNIGVTPPGDTTYTLTATGPSGTINLHATVTINCDASTNCPLPGQCQSDKSCQLPPAPVATFSANPLSIALGQTSQLSWTTTNATTVSIDPYVGTVALNGNTTVAPTGDTTYTLTATGLGGTITKLQKVTISCDPSTNCPLPGVCKSDGSCQLPPLPQATFTVNPNTIAKGQSATLKWTSTDADTVSINYGLGSEPLNGSAVVTPSTTTTYTLSASGTGGSITKTAIVTVACSNATNCALPNVCLSDESCGAPSAPTIVSGPSADPSPSYTTTTQLSILGNTLTLGGEPLLNYHWTLVGPSTATVSFLGDNSDNDAKSTTVKFNAPGKYTFNATVTDGVTHLSATSPNLDVQVISKAVTLVVSPKHTTIHLGDTFPFHATSTDQFGNSTVPPQWTASSGGAISEFGVLSALTAIRTITVTAAIDSLKDSGEANVLVPGAATDILGAYAYPVPWKSTMADHHITFTNLAADTHIRIYTADGRKVQELYSTLGERVLWDITNMNGERVASWVYPYIIDNPSLHQTVRGKLVVIQ